MRQANTTDCASYPATGGAPTHHFAHIDGLRAIAVLAVIAFHLRETWLPGGFLGVDVFFVISGFVVSHSVANWNGGHLGHFLAYFYSRRMLRILPALLVCLLATMLLTTLFVPPVWLGTAVERTGARAFFGISNFFLASNREQYFSATIDYNPFMHTWSLGVEEQFYLIAPLLLFVALGQHFSARRRFVGAIGIAALALLSLAATYYFGVTQGARVVFYQIIFRFWELAAGVLLYLLGSRVTILPTTWRRLYQLSGWLGLLLVALAMGLPKPTAYPWIRSTLAVVGTVLLIGPPGIERRDPLQPLLSSRPALWVGLRS